MDLQDDINTTAILGTLLYELGVRHIEAELSGSGDSGEIDDIRFLTEAGAPMDENAIEDAMSKIGMPTSHGNRFNAYDLLRDMVTEDATDAGNWYDGDGGSVSSRYDVSEAAIEKDYVDLSEFEPDDDDDDYDGEESDLDLDGVGDDDGPAPDSDVDEDPAP